MHCVKSTQLTCKNDQRQNQTLNTRPKHAVSDEYNSLVDDKIYGVFSISLALYLILPRSSSLYWVRERHSKGNI